MNQLRWSAADLERQWLVVRQPALRACADLRALEAVRDRLVADARAGVDLRALEAARDRLVADVRNALRGSRALAGSWRASWLRSRAAATPGR